MITTSPLQQAQAEADRLYTRFSNAIKDIAELAPLQQAQAAQGLSVDAESLRILKEKVSQVNLIGNVPELDALTFQLFEADDLLEKIQTYNDLSLEVVALSGEVQDAFIAYQRGKSNPKDVKSLQKRVEQMSKKSDVNFGLKSALTQLQTNLQQLHPRSPSTISTTSTMSTTISSSTLQSDSQICAATDEAYEVSLFMDQFKELRKELTNDPTKNFEMILEFYKTAKEYYLQKSKFHDPNDKYGMEVLMQEAEKLMGVVIDDQIKVETNQILSKPTQHTTSVALIQLKEELEIACKEIEESKKNKKEIDVLSLQSNVGEAFKGLSAEEREKLFNSLSAVLFEAKLTQRPLPKPLMTAGFNMWSNSYGHKLQALKNILPSSEPQNKSTATVSKAKSDKMYNRMVAAINAVAKKPQITLSPSKSRTGSSRDNSSNIIIHPPKNRTLDIRTNSPKTNSTTSSKYDPIIIQEERPTDQIKKSSIPIVMNGILELEALPHLLSKDGSYAELQNMCEKLFLFESKGDKIPFKISGNKPLLIGNRPCFHLYFIHKNERPEQLVRGSKYGDKAMAGILAATNLERARAIERTILELALEGLENATTEEDVTMILSGLERMQKSLVIDDLPNDKYNISRALFGQMYKLHKLERQTNSRLVDPDHSKFKKNFGREAFCIFDSSISLKAKLGAIQAVRKDLKTAWKVS